MNQYIYSYIIPLPTGVYIEPINRQHVFEMPHHNKIAFQLQHNFPSYDVEKTTFAFQTPKLEADKCSFNLNKKTTKFPVDEFLPAHFVTNFSSFTGLPLFRIEKKTSKITKVQIANEQKKLMTMFIYKQQLQDPTAPILYLLDNKRLEMKSYRAAMKESNGQVSQSKRNNCCFEHLIFINGRQWAFLNHDNCTSPDMIMVEQLVKKWFFNK